MGPEGGIVNSSSNLCSHTSSPTTFLNDRYSASAEKSEMVSCFLDFQLIGLPPKRTMKPVTDLLESGHAAQSESQNALRVRSSDVDKKIQRVGSCFKYLNMWNAAFK